MANFMKLVHNENIKIYSRVRTWVMLGILVLLSALFPVLISYSTSEDTSMWQGVVLTATIVFMLNSIFAVIIAADSVAGEFSWGTIKLLLIRPWSRSKILISKYIAVILFSLLTTVVLLVLSLLFSSLFLGGQEGSAPLSGNVSDGTYVALTFLYNYVDLFVILALAFMLSSVFRSSALAIGLSIFIIFTSSIFAAIFSPERFSWAKYILFNNMDLTRFIGTDVDANGLTLGFSAAVMAVYYIIFLVVGWLIFNRRDVAA
ncbi:DUF2705 family protein [Paenibacillus sp. JX-17]|uniref:DUF2705 family protein n=1 Tax=Paenibacillus lacisoli TaxID=3064525 RepID=A0ABT9CEY2_9BACL|nr:DUF2705 family protein [Paenibacillus sp. JX-17]MDO7907194.1 DUF2705 family protein [Paenibacillus sp. JX-17]